MKGFFYKNFIIVFIVMVAVALFSIDVFAKSKKAKFYDFSDQLINGEIKKPATIYMESRARAKFAKLLRLKKSFRRVLLNSYHDPLLK